MKTSNNLRRQYPKHHQSMKSKFSLILRLILTLYEFIKAFFFFITYKPLKKSKTSSFHFILYYVTSALHIKWYFYTSKNAR